MVSKLKPLHMIVSKSGFLLSSFLMFVAVVKPSRAYSTGMAARRLFSHHLSHKHQRQFYAISAAAPRRPAPTGILRRSVVSATKATSSDEELNRTGDRNGLVRYSVQADDGHVLRMYGRPGKTNGPTAGSKGTVLLLHGRTWSSQPVYDLRTNPTDERKQSLLQTLNELGFAAYALDFRGFGETLRDASGYTTPQRCVDDTKASLEWIVARHAADANKSSGRFLSVDESAMKKRDMSNETKPALLGWSQGALVAQLYAQQHGDTIRDLTLFGSIYDPNTVYPRRSLYESPLPEAPANANTLASALEDFTLPGTICDEAALAFGKLALAADPVKAPWNELHEFNALLPGLVQVPTHVIVGQQDPYVSFEAQRKLFEQIATPDKVLTILPDSDHAAHILQRRHMFVRAVVSFMRRKEEIYDFII